MHTFREAAESYVAVGGEERYLKRLIEYFEDRDLTSIVPAEAQQSALVLCPHLKPSSRNRQIITPFRAVMYHAHDLGWIGPMRVRRFKCERSKKNSPVSGEWLTAFINQSDSDGLHHLSALVLFMNHTAARVGEAVNLTGEWIDFRNKWAILVKTKTDTMAKAYLTDELMFRLSGLDPQPGVRVFRYTSKFSVNDRIRAVCRRAGIEFKTSHCVGRYSFATNALRLGLDIKTAMEAGRWRSSVIFLETYVHPEQAGRAVADTLNRQRYKYL